MLAEAIAEVGDVKDSPPAAANAASYLAHSVAGSRQRCRYVNNLGYVYNVSSLFVQARACARAWSAGCSRLDREVFPP